MPERVVVLQFRKQEKELREDVLIPRRISGHEGIGQLFEYRIEAVRSVANPDYFGHDDTKIDPKAIEGTVITLTFSDVYWKQRDWVSARERTGDREISGVVESAGVLRTEGNTVVHEFVIRPWWWRATLCKNSRIFTGVEGEIIHILHTVLKPYSNDIELRAGHNTGPLRDFIRQAWETDWDFCMRLCEEFGYLIWFEHHDGRHVLVIAESIRACHKHSHPYETLPYRPDGGHLDREHVTHLSSRTSAALGTVTVHDHSYVSPRLSRHSLPYREDYGITHDDETRLESYEPAEYAQPDTTAWVQQDGCSWRADARYLARVKLEAARCGRLRAKARGALRGIEAGKTLTLTDHPHDDANGEYLVLDCRLDIGRTPGTSTTLPEYAFEAEFGLHPTSEPYRMPQVTPRPHIGGCEHAVIVGDGDYPLTIDKYNRVRIQFAWDREGGYDGKSSIWVRVAQPWQGNQMGTVMHGRHGQPVLVAYVNGDPDRPIVAGFAPDELNMPPWKLPENGALTGIVSRTLGPDGTTNHLALDDTENRQQAQLASDHAKSSLSLGHITRIEGNAGRQDARGEGFELRTDKHGVLRAALGLLLTTIAKIGAAGKVKDMPETIARLTRSRDIHESLAQQAQRHGAQNATSDQSDVTVDMQRANAELRGKPAAGVDDFPEFDAPHLTLSSAAGIQTAAAGSTHIASDEHIALTAGGHVSIAAGKSFFASVRESLALYARKALTLITPGPVHIESRNGPMTQSSQGEFSITSTQGIVRISGKNGVDISCGGTLLRIRPEGITGYTNGKFLVHATNHATDNPQAKPVDYPVTPEKPGKLAAHHVLVENGGGFAVPNQPYRLTLDDGQVIEGVTSELGELQMVTSNVVAFGVVEFMSQSAPADVISVIHIAVHRDAIPPPPLAPPIPAKRTARIGGKTASTPEEGATTQGQPARYVTCDPMNFGLRRYRILNGAKADESPEYQSRSNIEYPVARQYTAAIKPKLLAINWADLAGKSDDDITAVIAPAVQEAVWAALQDGPFGL
ncbi:MAG TPA: type VI secretion system tip protein TssI/VgrG, partial [Paraburkholderia sp.]|nr:type VI secretion system tip protein TssI/VgrG [Paraburkholderia sp.]